IFFASGCWVRSSTRATTMPSSPPPMWTTDSTGVPSIPRSCPICSGEASNGANSRSQERRTFISELPEEADVVGDEVAHVVDPVLGGGEAVDAEAEGEPLPLLRVDAAVAQDIRVHHPAAAELEVRAVGADDVELGRR